MFIYRIISFVFLYSLRPFWNFDIPTNAVIKERAPFHLFPAHPEVEIVRNAHTVKLRNKYQELCHQREGDNF